MASPVNDSYAGPSAGVIAGGRVYIPAWRRSMATFTWTSLGNTLADINPRYDPAINPNYPNVPPWNGLVGHRSVFDMWNGAVWDEQNIRLVIPLCGGHADYAGNETYSWSAKTGNFTLDIKPTGAIGNTGVLDDGLESTGVYFDGQPRSYHTYANIQMRAGEVWVFGGAVYKTALGGLYPFRLPVGASQWVKDTPSQDGVGTGGAVVYDSLRDRFWYISAGTSRLSYYDPVAHAKTTITTFWADADGPYIVAAYDSRRDLLLRLGVGLTLFTLGTTPTGTLATVTGPRPAANNGLSTKVLGMEGFVYDEPNDRFLLWNGGGSIYILTPPAIGQNPLTSTWTWTERAPDASNTITPGVATNNGVYGRFWHSPRLNACGVVNAVTQQMHVFSLG